MEFEKNVIDELSNLKEIIGITENYEKLIVYFIDIINNYQVFDRTIKGVFSYQEKDSIYINISNEHDYTIYGNISKIQSFVKKLAKKFYKEYENYNHKEVDLEFAFAFLIHELAHLYQMRISEENNPIGEFYKTIIDRINDKRILSSIIYSIKKYHLSFERNANVVGFRETRRIYEASDLKNISNLFYLYYLFSEYKIYNGPKIISPSESTLFYFGIKKQIDYSSISFIDTMEHGLPVDNYFQYVESLFEYIDNKNLSEIDADEVIKKMLEVK